MSPHQSWTIMYIYIYIYAKSYQKCTPSHVRVQLRLESQFCENNIIIEVYVLHVSVNLRLMFQFCNGIAIPKEYALHVHGQ